MKGTIESISQLGLAFFGLTSNNIVPARASLFSQIHQIVFHGKGGYDWHTVYNMPIWLRKYTFNEMKKHYEEEKEAAENKGGSKGTKSLIDSSGKVNTPEFTKVSEQYKRPAKFK